MKFDHKPQTAKTAAVPPVRAGRGMVQLVRSLEGRGYDEQRTMVSPDGGDSGGEVEGDKRGEKPKNAKVILSARKGGNPLSRDFWVGLNVGHCWVDVIKPDGRKDSWGFTAKNPRNFPRTEPWTTVPGEVLHPDGSRGATGTLERDIDEDQLENAEKWGDTQGEDYNLFGFDGGHSCATFAKEFYEEASGEKAPTGSMFGALIASPNDLSAAMNKQLEKEREMAGETESVDAETAP